MAIYDVNDREILPETALETYYSQGQKITNCPPELFDRYELFDMEPGDGVYVPVTAPHWVRTLDEVSISISINFRTPSSIRRDRVYRVNRTMRNFRLRPAAVSAQADSFSDRTKSALLGLPARLKKMMRR
jgi:ribosomal protein L16 Arg81 hydroxylase